MLSEAKHLSADRDRPLAAKSMTMAHEDETLRFAQHDNRGGRPTLGCAQALSP
jgi:hypothetical protein